MKMYGLNAMDVKNGEGFRQGRCWTKASHGE